MFYSRCAPDGDSAYITFPRRTVNWKNGAHKNTNEKWEMMNAVMKCGPEKGHWVVLSEIETKS